MDIRSNLKPRFFVIFQGYDLTFTRCYADIDQLNSDLSVYSGYDIEKYETDGTNFARF